MLPDHVIAAIIIGPILRALFIRYIYPYYKRIEDRSRAKSKARIDEICARMEHHRS